MNPYRCKLPCSRRSGRLPHTAGCQGGFYSIQQYLSIRVMRLRIFCEEQFQKCKQQRESSTAAKSVEPRIWWKETSASQHVDKSSDQECSNTWRIQSRTVPQLCVGCLFTEKTNSCSKNIYIYNVYIIYIYIYMYIIHIYSNNKEQPGPGTFLSFALQPDCQEKQIVIVVVVVVVVVVCHTAVVVRGLAAAPRG